MSVFASGAQGYLERLLVLLMHRWRNIRVEAGFVDIVGKEELVRHGSVRRVSFLGSARQMRGKRGRDAVQRGGICEVSGSVSLVSAVQRKKYTKAMIAKATRIRHGTKRRQMNRSIMFSASIFIAHRGQPRAFCSSTLPQSRQVLVLIAIGPLQVSRPEGQRMICYRTAYTLLYWSMKFALV